MRALSIKVPIRKKSGNLSYAPRKSHFSQANRVDQGFFVGESVL